jgi:LDH2 family malate/lactate/ureidoglycolate dehydrogenase
MIENRIENIFKLFRTAFKMRKVNAETAKKVADSVADGYELAMTGDTGDWFDYSTVLKCWL